MNDGGPAFPCAKFIHGPNGSATVMMGGMSLRDYFAAAALTGYRSAYHQWYQKVSATGDFAEPSKFAEWAYTDADAMLAERDKTPAAERKE